MKKFLIKLSYTVLPLWIILVGTVLYISLYVSPRMSGDIGRVACIPFGFEYDRMLDKGALHDIYFKTINLPAELQHVRTTVLTIGDSFSQQRRIGYQNYLGKMGLDVVNMHIEPYQSPLQEAYNVLDRHQIDSTTVKVLILECVERDFELNVKAFKNVVPDYVAPLPAPELEPEPEPTTTEELSEPTTTNTKWSVERARNLILFQTGYKSPVFTATLARDLFNSDEPRTLYFYHEDINQGLSLSPAVEPQVRLVWQSLRQKAEECGVKLILMIATDKYDIYQREIVDNRFGAKTVNEDIERIIGPNPQLLMSKHYLLPLIERGEKDVFMFNDSHWSYKAADVIARELIKRIQ